MKKAKKKKKDLYIYPKMKIIVKSTKTISFDEQFEDSSASDTEVPENEKQAKPSVQQTTKSKFELEPDDSQNKGMTPLPEVQDVDE